MNIYTKSGLIERGRLTEQFKSVRWLRDLRHFIKPTKKHQPGQTYNYIMARFKSDKKWMLLVYYPMLFVFCGIDRLLTVVLEYQREHAR